VSLSLTAFAGLAGEGLRVRAAAGAERPAAELGVSELVAEAALLQARLDWFQSRLARLENGGPAR
jgi:hypothetical protein